MATSKTVASTPEIIRIHELLKLHLKPGPEDGQYIYDQGWDDETIAKAVNPRLRHNHVQRVRNENFGGLYKKPSPNGENRALTLRVSQLEAEVRRDTQRLSQLQKQLEQLAAGLGTELSQQ